MPWTAEQFKQRHNHGLTAPQAAHAARQANAIMRRGAPEGVAIATANKYAHRDDGGATPVVQTARTQDPLYQQALSSFQSQTPEQLQESALKLKGTAQGQIAQRLLQQRRILSANAPTGQPAADPQSGMPQSYALGGTLNSDGGVRLPERGLKIGASLPTPGGFLATSGPGRSDNLQIKPHADSYVLPADVVSGMGEGNSLAGAKALEGVFNGSTGPGGIAMPHFGGHQGHRMGPPHAPGGFGHGLARMSTGGTPVQKVPIVAAGGEYIVTPEQVKALGGGSIARGHKILDAFVLHVRKRTISEMRKLKGPVKS